jgi:hypothetical protein
VHGVAAILVGAGTHASISSREKVTTGCKYRHRRRRLIAMPCLYTSLYTVIKLITCPSGVRIINERTCNYNVLYFFFFNVIRVLKCVLFFSPTADRRITDFVHCGPSRQPRFPSMPYWTGVDDNVRETGNGRME